MGPTRMILGKPVIAAIAGHAVAGGPEPAVGADLRVVEETAVLGVFCPDPAGRGRGRRGGSRARPGRRGGYGAHTAVFARTPAFAPAADGAPVPRGAPRSVCAVRPDGPGTARHDEREMRTCQPNSADGNC